jgi:hypothetical protein
VTITCVSPQGHELQTDLESLLTADLRDTVHVEANRWIKRLRLVRYGSATLRERFTYRGDSLWWFTELYLHKTRRLEHATAVILALEAARLRHGAVRFVIDSGDAVTGAAALAFGRAHDVAVEVRHGPSGSPAIRWPSYLVGLTAKLSRLRPGRAEAPASRASIAAFIHTAFWKTADPQHEGYIGPVLDALATRVAATDLAFVGVGPRRNFRARRWWDPLTMSADARTPAIPIERLAPQRALDGSRALWRDRRTLAAEVTSGDDVRRAAIFRDCDLWDVLKSELQGAALLQWPWSARAMDEAGAALDALEPSVVLTYAEAGGWGRALVLEARRRQIRSVGIQHGFIYRHWLNYLHEPDEMADDGADRGFPRPDCTLLYDRYAERQLTGDGHFPPSSLAITGSARLEALASRVECLRRDRDAIRRRLDPGDRPLVLLAAKFSEIRNDLPALVSAMSSLPGVHLAIKPHPAETSSVYTPFAEGHANVALAPADADLATLLAAADAVVTKNSTVAIDGLVLDIPALVIGLPNNLSPFVDAGVMFGADRPDNIRQTLETLLYDRQARQRTREAAGAFVREYRLAPEPGSAGRAADRILALSKLRTR